MKQFWDDEELGKYWSLTYQELELLKTKPQKHHLAFCMQLKYYQYHGDVYACDHYVFPEYKRGNIRNKSLMKMAYSEEQVKFGNDKRDNLPNQCKTCEFLFACNGECPKNRISITKDGQTGLNYLCEGFKIFYKHIDPYMKFMANELRNNRPPSNVMNLFNSPRI